MLRPSKIVSYGGLILFLALSMPAGGGSKNLEAFEKQVTEFTLDNGMHFIIIRRDVAPVASFVTFVDVGSANEPVNNTGIAHMKNSPETVQAHQEFLQGVMRIDLFALREGGTVADVGQRSRPFAGGEPGWSPLPQLGRHRAEGHRRARCQASDNIYSRYESESDDADFRRSSARDRKKQR